MEPEQTTEQEKQPSRGIRVLVIVLLVQLLFAGVLIYFALAGWPWVPNAPAEVARPAVSERFLKGQANDGVPTPRVNNFDQKRAFSLLRRQVERYGWRPAGSANSRRLAAELRGRLPAGTLEPFTAGKLKLNNVVGVIPGRLPAVVVAAHYDVEARPKGVVGANDGAAGTAAVVELSRGLASKAVAGGREVRFLLFDGEEEPPGSGDFYADGMRGSRAYVARHAGQVGELILLDYVANRGLRLPHEGSSDVGLWAKLRAAAQRSGTGASFPDRSRGSIYDDHTPFLERGIPAINLIDFDYPWRDTLADTVNKLSPRALDVTGETVYSLVDELRRR
jgi:glutaminyl-peptide cyclotransferase